ncbi:hypothetical protein PybrP1_003187 [[Pythium] brassicae (nom. inval.)]|nr:hypothetical protein PybrP1_003187 [[Pythium] brassicae (nom. inval.)]
MTVVTSTDIPAVLRFAVSRKHRSLYSVKQFDVTLGHHKLGVMFTGDGAEMVPVVKGIMRRHHLPATRFESRLSNSGAIRLGDVLVGVNGLDAVVMGLERAMALIASTKARPMKLTFHRFQQLKVAFEDIDVEFEYSAAVGAGDNDSDDGIMIVWKNGPLGLTLTEDDISGLPLVNRLTGKGSMKKPVLLVFHSPSTDGFVSRESFAFTASSQSSSSLKLTKLLASDDKHLEYDPSCTLHFKDDPVGDVLVSVNNRTTSGLRWKQSLSSIDSVSARSSTGSKREESEFASDDDDDDSDSVSSSWIDRPPQPLSTSYNLLWSEGSLGIAFDTYEDSDQGRALVIYVKRLLHNGHAKRTRLVSVGDRLVHVNRKRVEATDAVSFYEAMRALETANKPVILGFQRPMIEVGEPSLCGGF